MKKINKTYHLQESVPRGNSSPGRIVKNQNKSLKEKQSQRQNISTSQSRKDDFEEINKKTQERIEKNELSKKSDQSYECEEGYVSYFGESKHLQSVERGEMGFREEPQLNPYEQIYQSDMKYFQEYLNSTAKYEFNGINLNWPYYFTKNQPSSN